MGKVTLRKVEGGIVATIDERPLHKEAYYDASTNIISIMYRWNLLEDLVLNPNYDKIIASTIPNVGKELEFVIKQDNLYASHIGWYKYIQKQDGKQYDYTETETKVIIYI